MTILYIVGEFPSQTEHFIQNEIDFLRRNGYTIYVVCLKKVLTKAITTADGFELSTKQNWWKGILKAFGMFVHHPIKTWGYFHNAQAFSQKKLLKVMRDWLVCICINRQLPPVNFDHIHAHFAGWPSDIGFIFSLLLKRNFSFSAHAHDIYTAPHTIKKKSLLSDFVITCTGYNKSYLVSVCGCPEEKINLVYHGLNVNKWVFKRISNVNSGNLILTIGRLVEKKGVIILLKAALLLKTKNITFRIVIIGEGPEQNSLKAFVRNKGLKENVFFLPTLEQTHLQAHYHAADMFILPCVIDKNGDRDGIPNVLMEAMACGTPVISSNLSAIPELVVHNETGILVRPGDPVDLFNAIETLINDPMKKNELARNARKTLESSWTLDRSNQKILSLFSKQA